MAPAGSDQDGAGQSPPVVTREIAAEAAVWVARLHGPSRSRAMERDCLAWQARSAAHRHAFERCTETWMDVPSVTVAGAFAAAGQGAGSRSRVSGAMQLLLGVAGVGLVAALAWTWQPWRTGVEYRTGVGELQSLVLADGSRLSLNTDTQVRVELEAHQRTVSVERGEALFDVAKDAQRPFVVRAAASEVVALGTLFSVRLTPPGATSGQSLAVTLIEGQVALRPAGSAAAAAVAPPQQMLLRPGERVRLVASRGGGVPVAPAVDRPRLEQVVAWQRSEAVFDDTALVDAVAEMNRYSRTPIVLAADVAAAGWRVSGQFRAGDNAGFARAVASLHGLALRQTSAQFELSRAPTAN